MISLVSNLSGRLYRGKINGDTDHPTNRVKCRFAIHSIKSSRFLHPVFDNNVYDDMMIDIFLFLIGAGATDLLVEWEDMFPYWGPIANISAK